MIPSSESEFRAERNADLQKCYLERTKGQPYRRVGQDYDKTAGRVSVGAAIYSTAKMLQQMESCDCIRATPYKKRRGGAEELSRNMS